MHLYGNCHYLFSTILLSVCDPILLLSFCSQFAISSGFATLIGRGFGTKFVIILLFWILNSLADPTWAGCQVQEFGINRNFLFHSSEGSLEDALAESCQKTGSEKKMLALYLHHDREGNKKLTTCRLSCIFRLDFLAVLYIHYK